MKLELNIPLNFFVSSREENHFESVSERTAKIFLSQILNIKNLRRGNEKDKEPDYISSKEGYEVTFSINEALIPQLRGRKPLLYNPQNIEKELISNIKNAIAKKESKNYSISTNLVVLALNTLPTWYFSLFDSNKHPYVKALNLRRNYFFNDLFCEYIEKGKFNNLYIIMPTCFETFALFDIKGIIKGNIDDFIHIKPNNPQHFATYKVIDVNQKGVFNLEISVINWI